MTVLASGLVNRVIWGTGPGAVACDTVSAGLALSASVVPARARVLVYDGAGDPQYIGGPGADRVQVTVTGQGRQPPALASLAAAGCTVTIDWPSGQTTVLSLTAPAGVGSRDTDLKTAITGWTWTGIGTVTSGADPLGR